MHTKKDRTETRNVLGNWPLPYVQRPPPQAFFCMRCRFLDLRCFKRMHCIFRAQCCLNDSLALFRISSPYDYSLSFGNTHGPALMAEIKNCVAATMVHCNIWSCSYSMQQNFSCILRNSWNNKNHCFPQLLLLPVFPVSYTDDRDNLSTSVPADKLHLPHPTCNYQDIKCPKPRFWWYYSHNRCLFPNKQNLHFVYFCLTYVY